MREFLQERRTDLLFSLYQHASLVFQCVLVATLIAVALAVVINRYRALEPLANAASAVGLTLPSFALIGLLLPVAGLGTATSFVCITFYAILPILRNAVVGLAGVDKTLLESARGMGMSGARVMLRVQLPLAWPVILAGVRTSMQMSMGVAAIAAYILGPGMGKYIWDGLAQAGGVNGLNFALVGTIGIVIVALIADLVLLVLGRLTISKGIRVA